jgi:hypothetical protein
MNGEASWGLRKPHWLARAILGTLRGIPETLQVNPDVGASDLRVLAHVMDECREKLLAIASQREDRPDVA